MITHTQIKQLLVYILRYAQCEYSHNLTIKTNNNKTLSLLITKYKSNFYNDSTLIHNLQIQWGGEARNCRAKQNEKNNKRDCRSN